MRRTYACACREAEHHVCLCVCDAAQIKLTHTQLLGVGVGCPGILQEHGVIHAAANFPSWSDVPLQQLFVERLNGLQVRASCLTLQYNSVRRYA